MDRYEWGFLIGVIVVVMVSVLGGLWMSQTECHQKWGSSGMSVRWTVIGGCQVQPRPGIWMPTDSIKEINL